MRDLIVSEWMSLDGVMQAPSYPDEDTSGGFPYGGWHRPYLDDVSRAWVVENLRRAGGFVFGAHTYATFADHWPDAGEEEQAVAEPLNTKPKWVASASLSDPLPWRNSTLLSGDVGDAVAALKRQDGGDLYLIGSARLAQALIDHDLVDGYRLMIDPIVVGSGGKRLFEDYGALRRLRLTDQRLTSTGAILATYARAA